MAIFYANLGLTGGDGSESTAWGYDEFKNQLGTSGTIVQQGDTVKVQGSHDYGGDTIDISRSEGTIDIFFRKLDISSL